MNWHVVPEPNFDSHVFCRIREDVGTVELDSTYVDRSLYHHHALVNISIFTRTTMRLTVCDMSTCARMFGSPPLMSRTVCSGRSVDLNPGDLCIVQYRPIRPLVLEEKLELW